MESEVGLDGVDVGGEGGFEEGFREGVAEVRGDEGEKEGLSIEELAAGEEGKEKGAEGWWHVGLEPPEEGEESYGVGVERLAWEDGEDERESEVKDERV